MEIDPISMDDIHRLLPVQRGWCVSIYLPTHYAGREVRQDAIRFKNLLTAARDELLALGVRDAEAHDMLDPAESLVTDDFFWLHQAKGLAVFISPGLFRYYRLDAPFEEYAGVSAMFHIKPLIPLCLDNVHFYIIALSQKNIRLLECFGYRVRRIDHPDIPRDLHSALRYEPTEKTLLFFTLGSTGGGRHQGISHAHGIGPENAKKELLLFCQRVNDGVCKALDGEYAPLIVAAVEQLHSRYLEANSYPRIVGDRGIMINPENLGDDALRHEGLQLMGPLLAAGRQRAAERFTILLGEKAPTALSRLDEILPAAVDGKLDTLFVPVEAISWGSFDPSIKSMTVHRERQPGDYDLYNQAAIHTLLNKGTVYALPHAEMPSRKEIAAITRY